MDPVNFYQKNTYTSGLLPIAIQKLAEATTQVTLKRREILWSPGESAQTVYFIRSGMIKMAQSNQDGRELILHLVSRGEFFGHSSVYSGGVRTCTASSHEDTVLYEVDADDIYKLSTKVPELGQRLTEACARRRQAVETRLKDLIFKNVSSRLSQLFLELSREFGVRDSRGVIINLRLTHKDMASLIGATRETVSFAILDLRKKGAVMTKDRRVIILNEELLEEIAKG